MQERIKTAATPPRVTPDPASFLVAARVVDGSSHLGLPGLQVQLVHPQGENVLAEAVTDVDGNAVLALARDPADGLAKARVELGIRVSTSEGKVVHEAEQAICPRLGHVETWVGGVSKVPDLEPLVAVASELKTRREARVSALVNKARMVQTYFAERRKDIDCEQEETRAVVEAIRKEMGTDQGGGPTEPGGPGSGAPTQPRRPAPPGAPPETSTPLENVRGIGPKIAARLRAAGIKDIEMLLRTDTAELIRLAGFDARLAKEKAESTREARDKPPRRPAPRSRPGKRGR